MNQASIAQIARVAHEVNRAYCVATGDNSQPNWEEAPIWQRDSAMNGVRAHLAALSDGRELTPEQSHQNWMKQKLAEGWVWGPDKNPDASPPTHHCLVPYNQLPLNQRVKDYLFGAVVKALASSPEFR